MTREKAIEILIAVAVCDRPILSCDFCTRYVGMGTDCTYPSDKEIEESVLFLKGASKDMAISALRQQEHFRDLTKKVEPLTLDELREMGGEPVWVKLFDPDEEFWVLRNEWVDTRNPEPMILFHMCWYSHADYGKTWQAYRQKQEEGAV